MDLYLTEDATYWGSLILPEDVAYGAIVDEGVMAGVIFEPNSHIKGVAVQHRRRAGICPSYEIGVPLFFTMNRPSSIDVTTTIPDLKNG